MTNNSKGGIGVNFANLKPIDDFDHLQVRGRPISSGHSTGVIPFLKNIGEVMRSVSVGQSRPRESMADYTSAYHPDIEAFIRNKTPKDDA